MAVYTKISEDQLKKFFLKYKKQFNFKKHYTEKVLIFNTCYVNYNDSKIGEALVKVLEKNKVYMENFYEGFCKMPQLEQGKVHEVQLQAEKTASILKEKIDLAAQMKDSKMFSTDYIYETIFSLSEDQYNAERDLVREDSKRTFRLGQLEGEGNDPAKSGRSYGTPHDLASMYGRRATATEKGPANVPPGYGEPGPEGGRPREKFSVYGTNDDPVGGRDRLGQQGMKGGFPSDNEYVNENLNTKAVYHKNKESLDALKVMVFDK